MPVIRGKVSKLLPPSPVDGKTVITLTVPGGNTVTAFGDFPGVTEGMELVVSGSYNGKKTKILHCESFRKVRSAERSKQSQPARSESLFKEESQVPNEFDGTVEKVTFCNEESGFSILRVRPDSKRQTVAVCGTLPGIKVGIRLHVKGEWSVHPKYGPQLECEQFQIIIPTESDGILKYLSSGIIPGIGKKTATRIVTCFGNDTLTILDADPSRISEVKGLSKKKTDTIIRNWSRSTVDREVMVFLGKNGLPTTLASKIVKRYGLASMETLRRNPYTLADEIGGIGFKTADIIARGLGIGHDDEYRVKCGLRYAMLQGIVDGNTYLTREQAIRSAQAILDLDRGILSKALDDMVSSVLLQDAIDVDIIEENGALYLKQYYSAEASVASNLSKLQNGYPSGSIDGEIDFDQLQEDNSIEYDDLQKEAIRTAVSQKVVVITGGPGTGKTTITNAIIKVFEKAGMSILLCSPTGRAAKRLSSATGYPATTIHRLLEADEEGFAKDEHQKIEGDVLIADEASMIDILLMNAMLKALPVGMRLILIGDVDQLPSVGSGNVLRDVIESGVVPTVRLQRIYRQEGDSRIISNAHLINMGNMPDLSNGLDTDFFFIRKDTPEEIRDCIHELVLERLPAKYNVYPNEIQILTPMRKTLIGVSELNVLLQKSINPGEAFYRREDTELRVSDKVMQTKNDRVKNVFNGDIGIIEAIVKDEDGEFESATIRFEDGRTVPYDRDSLEELELAYATTVHKSQGSEYPIVVIPVSEAHHVMLRRNLLYTAVTRAKRICILVGTRQAVSYMVRNNDIVERNTRLKERLQAYGKQIENNN